MLSTCWGHPPQKLGGNSYSSAILVTKATYYPRVAAQPCFMFPWKKPCLTVRTGLLSPFSPCLLQLQALPSLSNSFHCLLSLTGSSSYLLRVSGMTLCGQHSVQEELGPGCAGWHGHEKSWSNFLDFLWCRHLLWSGLTLLWFTHLKHKGQGWKSIACFTEVLLQ